MRNELTLGRLCQELQSNCGDLLRASQAVGVSLIFVRQWAKDDQKVAEKLKEAEQVGVQGLVSAAIHRAVNGVQDDVYFKGCVVGQKTNYSDGLLTTLLKAKLPEFTASEGGGVHVNVNVAQIMPRAEKYDDWLAMKDATLATRALPPPVVIEDAEFTEAKPFAGIDL